MLCFSSLSIHRIGHQGPRVDPFSANTSGEQCGEVIIESHFDIDRTRWGITYGSARFFERLGMHLVFDLISIQLRIVAR